MYRRPPSITCVTTDQDPSLPEHAAIGGEAGPPSQFRSTSAQEGRRRRVSGYEISAAAEDFSALTNEKTPPAQRPAFDGVTRPRTGFDTRSTRTRAPLANGGRMLAIRSKMFAKDWTGWSIGVGGRRSRLLQVQGRHSVSHICQRFPHTEVATGSEQMSNVADCGMLPRDAHRGYTDTEIRTAASNAPRRFLDTDEQWLRADALEHYRTASRNLSLIKTLSWNVAVSTLQSSVRTLMDERDVPKYFLEEHRYRFYLTPFFDASSVSGQRYTTTLYYSPPCAMARRRAAKVLVYGYAVHEDETRNTVYMIVCDNTEQLRVITDDFMYHRVGVDTRVDVDFAHLNLAQEKHTLGDPDYAALADNIVERLSGTFWKHLDRLASGCESTRPSKLARARSSPSSQELLARCPSIDGAERDAEANLVLQDAPQIDQSEPTRAQAVDVSKKSFPERTKKAPASASVTHTMKNLKQAEMQNILLNRTTLALQP
ncbi:hypothetical protein CYMTET_37065 [Cymbomonas tetramitiformis]|uniref:Uncharacterized protein n=1 Tax=Cymbomonas tetramitiformis TaxID=36881 RepID=A0AAE0CGK1_9CHLO|nr:hypothetical protein CYMTET_37065 [Cymbomonas tetramitiformis]